jgi:hydrogenase/urease accessory protein HupE
MQFYQNQAPAIVRGFSILRESWGNSMNRKQGLRIIGMLFFLITLVLVIVAMVDVQNELASTVWLARALGAAVIALGFILAGLDDKFGV